MLKAESYLKHSPLGPTTSTDPPHDKTKALSPHHSAPSGIPISPKDEISTSDSDLEKSDETTHRIPAAVIRAIKRPLGESRMWEKGPLDIRWSTRSRASRVTIVPSAEMRISTCPLVDWSGGTMDQA